MSKLTTISVIMCLMSGVVLAQSKFTFLGEGEKSEKDLRKLSGVMAPQLSVGFETYSVTTIMESESKVSAIRGNLATVGTNKNYTRQSSLIEASTILNANMEKEDFQQLTNDFQKILEEELTKGGVRTIKLAELQGMKEYRPIRDQFAKKTDKVSGKQETADISKDKIYYLADNSLMIYKGEGIGHGVATITKLKKLVSKADAVMLLHNIDVDFAVVKIDAEVGGGWSYGGSSKYKSTKANLQVFPIMNISDLKLTLVNSTGSITPTPIRLKDSFLAEKSYPAKMYHDEKKSESLFMKMFSLKAKRDIEFDPMIIEMEKEVYMNAARDLFRQYSAELAKEIAYSQSNKK
jgi:hypothetical protein